MQIGRNKKNFSDCTEDTYSFTCDCGYNCEFGIYQKEELEKSINEHLEDRHEKMDLIETITDKLIQRIEN